MSIIVVDGGKRYFKYKSESSQGKISSLVGMAQDLTLHQENDSTGYEVLINGEDLKGKYFVGDLAKQSFNASLSVNKNYCLEPEHKVLFLTSIALISSSLVFTKVLSSLQINDYKKYRQQYINQYLHKSYVVRITNNKQVLITFSEFDVFPQGGADIFSLSDNLLINKKTGVINIGYRDINCCVVNWTNTTPQYESSLSFSFNSGIYEADLAIIKRINQQYDMDLSIEHLQDFIKRNLFDPSPEYKALAQKISLKVKQIWQNLADFNQIFFSGGGSLLLKDFIIPYFPNSQLLPITNPQYGNVEGMWKVAVKQFN